MKVIFERKLMVKHGTEGPSADPYGYIERIVFINGIKIIYHNGLAEWTDYDGVKIYPDGEHQNMPQELFETMTGINVDDFDLYFERVHRPKIKCTDCGSRRFEYFFWLCRRSYANVCRLQSYTLGGRSNRCYDEVG